MMVFYRDCPGASLIRKPDFELGLPSFSVATAPQLGRKTWGTNRRQGSSQEPIGCSTTISTSCPRPLGQEVTSLTLGHGPCWNPYLAFSAPPPLLEDENIGSYLVRIVKSLR